MAEPFGVPADLAGKVFEVLNSVLSVEDPLAVDLALHGWRPHDLHVGILFLDRLAALLVEPKSGSSDLLNVFFKELLCLLISDEGLSLNSG